MSEWEKWDVIVFQCHLIAYWTWYLRTGWIGTISILCSQCARNRLMKVVLSILMIDILSLIQNSYGEIDVQKYILTRMKDSICTCTYIICIFFLVAILKNNFFLNHQKFYKLINKLLMKKHPHRYRQTEIWMITLSIFAEQCYDDLGFFSSHKIQCRIGT